MGEQAIEEELDELREESCELVQSEEDKYIKHVEIDDFDYPISKYKFRKARTSKFGGALESMFREFRNDLSWEECDELMAGLYTAVDVWAEENDFEYERQVEAGYSDGIEYIKNVDYSIEEIDTTISCKVENSNNFERSVKVKSIFRTSDSDYIEEYQDLDAIIRNMEGRIANTRLIS